MDQHWRLAALALSALAALGGCGADRPHPRALHERRVIVFVWDGMRPDAVNDIDTPHLAALTRGGTDFTDNHSSYPTFTMMNAAALASGAFSGVSGFFGNTVYRPGAPARDANGEPVDFGNPVFTEDYGILAQLDANEDEHLMLVGTLFQQAQRARLTTAAIGKSGPAFLQDYKTGGVVLDEKSAFPLAFARELAAAGIALPATAPLAYRPGELKLAQDNGDPTFQPGAATLADAATQNPDDRSGSPPAAANRYLMSVYLDYILPRQHPNLSLIWLRNPDTTEHAYGIGSPNYHAALKAQDELLGKLEEKLAELGLDQTTDLIVVSDHGHSNVSGPLDLFPLRKVENGKMGEIDRAHGYSVSGDVRLAHELSTAGIRAYDGGSCMYDPVMSGIRADGRALRPTQQNAGICAGHPYTTPDYRLLHPFLPREAFVVAANGGSDYLYLPDHDPERIRAAVRFLQSHEEYGAIFVDARYGDIPGTLPLDRVRLENAEGRNPDIVVGYSFDEQAMIQGMPGIEFEGVAGGHGNHGMHGSFSPIDVHNLLIAAGPDFAKGFADPLPSGNVDVAPTVAAILGLTLPQADGRALREALHDQARLPLSDFHVENRTLMPSSPATDLAIESPIGTATGKSSYTFELRAKELHRGSEVFTYFDWAKAVRR